MKSIKSKGFDKKILKQFIKKSALLQHAHFTVCPWRPIFPQNKRTGALLTLNREVHAMNANECEWDDVYGK